MTDIQALLRAIGEVQAEGERAEEAVYWEWHYTEGLSMAFPPGVHRGGDPS